MSLGTSLNVTLTPELEKFIKERLATGRNSSAEDVVHEALTALESSERDIDLNFVHLKAKLQRAAAEEQIEGATDGEAFMDELVSRLQKRRKPPGAA